MKKVLFFAVMAVATSLLGGSCGGPKSIANVNDEKEVSIPCQDKRTDKDFFRGMGVGQSKDLNTAREKALMAAHVELAGSISTLIKRVAERYVNDAGQVPSDYAGIWDAMSKEIVKQQISNLSTACEKTTLTKDKMYKVYLTREAGKEEVFATIARQAEANKKLETIFFREKFRKNFNEEMDAFAQEYGQ
jgi:hypothetical protein